MTDKNNTRLPSYQKIARDLARQQYCIIPQFLSPDEIGKLRAALAWHRREDHFKKAGIGHIHQFQINRQVRGDYIKWIEPERALPATAEFLARCRELMKQLNRLLFLSLKDFECHFALYPPGSFYQKHLDQFKGGQHRKISLACYLNHRWKENMGGALRLYREDGSYQDIMPQAGTMVLFRSDSVEHEVLPTKRTRYSITGWMRDKPLNLPFP